MDGESREEPWMDGKSEKEPQMDGEYRGGVQDGGVRGRGPDGGPEPWALVLSSDTDFFGYLHKVVAWSWGPAVLSSSEV